MASKAGHDLVLEVTKWHGTVNVDAANPSATSIEVSADPRSFVILSATGGVKALSDKDRGEIATNSDKTLNTGKFPEITFKSTGVTGTAPKLNLSGDLTISGSTRPVTLAVTVSDAGGDVKFSGTTALTHSDFGVKPYSKLGALKIKDEVDIAIELTLPSA
jgi:polyisoprenoid-binding protein YceI